MSSPDPAARPAFVVVRAGDDGTYVGGLMVTDASGLPVDFRYTDPVTPTRLQRALYGAVLDRYLRSEVVLRTLLDALESPPSLLLIDDPELLDEPIDACPVALVAASRADPIGMAGARSAEGAGTFLLQASEAAHPVRVSLPDGSPHEREVVDALVAMSARMDVLEPAERVRDALAVIVAGEAGP
jgi:hypothetical protein